MSASLISSFGRAITVRRTSGSGSYVDGMWVQPGIVEQTIIASVQRLSPKEVLLLKEGDRAKESRKVYSTFEFRTQVDGSMQQSDYLLIDGKEFMVVSVEDFVMNGKMTLKYFRANAVSVNPNPS